MVYLFFCVSGALDPLNLNFSVLKRQSATANMRRLEADVWPLTETLCGCPGAGIVVGNTWPFH